jgi:hypothetical protein
MRNEPIIFHDEKKDELFFAMLCLQVNWKTTHNIKISLYNNKGLSQNFELLKGEWYTTSGWLAVTLPTPLSTGISVWLWSFMEITNQHNCNFASSQFSYHCWFLSDLPFLIESQGSGHTVINLNVLPVVCELLSARKTDHFAIAASWEGITAS